MTSMELIFKIAWRNILRHKGKSIIIGVILFIGAFLMTVGNGVIEGMDRGLEQNIVNGFIGDMVIVSDKEKSDNILFKIMGESVETITNYPEIKKVLTKSKDVKDFLPAGKNTVMILNENEGDPTYAFIFGVDLDAYRKFFPDSFKTIEGGLWNKGESGLIMPKFIRSEIYDQMGVWFAPKGQPLNRENLSDDAKANIDSLNVKDNAVIMGLSDDNSNSDIRINVNGIIKYRALNTLWGHFSLMDIESYRKCLGYITASDASSEVSSDKKKLLELDNENLDAMFGTQSLIVTDKGNADISSINFKRKEEKTGNDIDLEKGTYNIIMVKLRNSDTLDQSIKSLNKDLSKAKLGVHAVTWKKASGFIGNMAVIIKGALFLFVAFLFFVAIIIIVNTLSMAAIERTTEIGMMRAIGTQKGFIAKMFVGETAMLSFLFGGIGIIAGIIVINVIPSLHITSANDLVQLLYGGDTFLPTLSIGGIILVILELTAVTAITVLYPIRVATKITPLDAISRE